MGTFIRHLPCPSCGSSDGNALYEDGSTYCHVCYAYGHSVTDATGDKEHERMEDGAGSSKRELLDGTFSDIPKRGLREDTCRKFGYRLGEFKGSPCQIADYFDKDGRRVAQKVRLPGKDFVFLGVGKAAQLFGQHLWGSGGKSVVVTEGEIDCLSVSQAFNNKYPVVSIKNGAPAAAKELAAQYEWLDTFEKVVLCFDNDEAGRKAIEECVQVLPTGKAYVMRIPGYKDANEALVGEGSAPITKAFWSASLWRPDGIISGTDITLQSLKKGATKAYSTPYPRLNELLGGGIRKRELTLLSAGTGIGKSTLAREIDYHFHREHRCTVGNVFLEESKEKTAQGFIAIHNDVPLGYLRQNPEHLSDEVWERSMEETVHSGRMFFYDHFGSLGSASLLAKLRYLAVVERCDFIFLDHISIVISGETSSSEGERRDIDLLMTRLRQLIEETGVGIVAIVHLKQPEGKPHEEGGRVTLSHLRGSGSLKQIPDAIVVLERDQQGDTPDETTVRVLKNREFGDLGVADTLLYSKRTGRLLPTAQRSSPPAFDAVGTDGEINDGPDL